MLTPIQNRSACLPVRVFDFAVFHSNGFLVAVVRSMSWSAACSSLRATCTQTSSSVSGIWPKSPWIASRRSAKHLVNAIFDRVTISEIRNPDFAARLADALNAALALLEPRRVPGKVDVDERAEALKVQTL